MIVRDDRQVALAELRATAAGLLVRYRALAEADIDPALRAVLGAAVARRAPLVDELGDRARERGENPEAADLELNQYRSVADRLGAWAVGDRFPLNRVADAEQAWQARVRALQGLDWRPQEKDLIGRLLGDSDRLLERLRRLQT